VVCPRCDETAALQQAFRFVNEPQPLVPTVLEAAAPASSSSPDVPNPSRLEAAVVAAAKDARPALGVAAAVASQEGQQQRGSTSDNESEGHRTVPGLTVPVPRMRRPASGSTGSTGAHASSTVEGSSTQGSSSQGLQAASHSVESSSSATPAGGAAAPANSQGQQRVAVSSPSSPPSTPTVSEQEEEEEQFDLQKAGRLSYASLQWLPQSTTEVSC
jgi:hypothetical protein